MRASLDIINVLKKELSDLHCPASTLATLAGVSGGRLSTYLNEVAPCPAPDELKLRETLALVKRLVEYSRPLPLDFRRCGEIRRSIDLMESGALKIVLVDGRVDQATEQKQ